MKKFLNYCDKVLPKRLETLSLTADLVRLQNTDIGFVWLCFFAVKTAQNH